MLRSACALATCGPSPSTLQYKKKGFLSTFSSINNQLFFLSTLYIYIVNICKWKMHINCTRNKKRYISASLLFPRVYPINNLRSTFLFIQIYFLLAKNLYSSIDISRIMRFLFLVHSSGCCRMHNYKQSSVKSSLFILVCFIFFWPHLWFNDSFVWQVNINGWDLLLLWVYSQ